MTDATEATTTEATSVEAITAGAAAARGATPQGSTAQGSTAQGSTPQGSTAQAGTNEAGTPQAGTDETRTSHADALDREIAIEQRHVDRVYARLAVLREAAARAEKEGYGLARVGTFGSLVERDAMVFHAAQRRHVLDAEHEGLVFGRLDMRDGSVLYVGRLGVRGPNTEPLVIDWRAPAAAAFYQATAANPLGVVRRRMIQSSGERVTGITDDLLDPAGAPPGMAVVGDGALLAALSRAKGSGMRDIVATIQREQDEAIRSPASGVTFVSGGPGTGKTAVALHRAAYLLYSDRSRFAGGGILVVGPSGVFVEYISAVLPSLGEETATLRSLGSLVEGVDAGRVDPAPVAAVKGSLRMRRVLERAVRDAVPGGPDELRLLYRGGLLRLTRPELDAIRAAALPRGARRNEVRRAGIDGLFDALWAQAQQVLRGRLPGQLEFEDDLSEHPDFRDFLRAWWPMLRPARVLGWLTDPDRVRRYAQGILSTREIELLVSAYRELPELGPTIADVALLDELNELLGQSPFKPRRRRDPFHVAGGVREISTFAERHRAARAAASQRPEDYREYAHVVVDEAQDVSPMQWRMLGRRGHLASWTVVGDPAQSAWTGDPTEIDRARDSALRHRRRSVHTLSTNYRNSAEIFELAAEVIRQVDPGIPLPVAVRATGVRPVQRLVDAFALPDAVREATAALLAEVEGTVGVITAVRRRVEAAGWLADLAAGVRTAANPAAEDSAAGNRAAARATANEPTANEPTADNPATGDRAKGQPEVGERLRVVSSLEAKGMEYDGVVLVEPWEIRTEARSGARTLYVALSRATQRLTTVATRPWLTRSRS